MTQQIQRLHANVFSFLEITQNPDFFNALVGVAFWKADINVFWVADNSRPFLKCWEKKR